MKPTCISTALILALAGTVRADFIPITLTPGSFSQDMVVEHNAPQVPNGGYTTASMDAGTANTGNSWYEQGYDAAAPATGLPAAGSTFVSAAFPTHRYTMPPSYTANNAAFIDVSHSATLTPATPAAFAGLSLLTAAGNGPVIIDYTVHHADASTDTGSLSSQDWLARLIVIETPPLPQTQRFQRAGGSALLFLECISAPTRPHAVGPAPTPPQISHRTWYLEPSCSHRMLWHKQ